jgi:hypothetical protein
LIHAYALSIEKAMGPSGNGITDWLINKAIV